MADRHYRNLQEAIRMWKCLATIVFVLRTLPCSQCHHVQKKKGVSQWTVMYEDMSFKLPCFNTKDDTTKLKQSWTKAPTEFYKDSENFTLRFNFVRFIDSGEYVCKLSTGEVHRHMVTVMSQPESLLVASRRYFPKEGCSSDLSTFLVQEAIHALCQPDVIGPDKYGYCLFKVDSSCDKMDPALKMPYKWDLLVTWTLPVPKLPKLGDTLKKCKSDLTCVAKERYKSRQGTMATAHKEYVGKETKSYELNPKELGEKVVRAKNKWQHSDRLVAQCPAGTYLTQDVTCKPCSPGEYLPAQTDTLESSASSCLKCQDAQLAVYGAYDCYVTPTGRPTVPTVATFPGQVSNAVLLARDWNERVPLKIRLTVYITPALMVLAGIIYCVWKCHWERKEAARVKAKLQEGARAKQLAAQAAQQQAMEEATALLSEPSSKTSLKQTGSSAATTATSSAVTSDSDSS